jgi:hypothetical protein
MLKPLNGLSQCRQIFIRHTAKSNDLINAVSVMSSGVTAASSELFASW